MTQCAYRNQAAARRAARFAAILCTTALISPLAAIPSFAQDSAAEEADDGAIIVTAQRRNERLEDVPMSVAVVTQETLASAGINSVRDLQNVTSGFQLGNSGNTPQPAIRGITTTNAGSYENNIALFVDGLYQFSTQVLNMDLPNVQSIQILKGPQGTLYGRNATGGAILIDTMDPGDTVEGNVEVTYGRFDDKRARGYVSGPVTDRIGFSIAGTIRRTDGYFKKASRTVPGQFDGNFLGLKQESIRTKLKFDLSDSFRATLAYNYTHADDDRGVVFTPIENVPNSYSALAQRDTRPRGLGEVAGDVFDVDFKQHEGSLKLEYDSGIGKLRSISGYAKATNRSFFDFNGNYAPDLYSGSVVKDRTLQQSIDYNIDAIEKLNLIIGGNYYNVTTKLGGADPSTTWLGPSSYSPFTPTTPATNPLAITDPAYRRLSNTFFDRKKEAWAIFADATFQATDQLSINIGARYSEETQQVSGSKFNYCVDPTSTRNLGCTVGALLPLTSLPGGVSGSNPALATGIPYNVDGTPATGTSPAIPSSRRSSHYSKFTPRASIRYEISPGTNIYASYSKGFRGGEWNGIIPSDNPSRWLDAKQETIDAYEIGLKSASRRLRFELAGFYYDYKDLQVSNTQNLGGVPVVVLANAPKAKVYGVDASIDFEVVENLIVRAGATWLHARYGDGFYFAGTGVNRVVGTNTNSDPIKTLINTGQAAGALAGIAVTQDLSGMQMARAPDFTGFFGFNYNIPMEDGGLRFSANVKYTTSYVVTNPSIWGGDTTYAARISDANPANDGPPINTQILSGTPYESRSNEQRARQGAYALVNASATWTDPSDSYYIRVWGNNLTNVKYRTHYNPLSAGTYSPIGEPLTYGGTIGYKF